MLKSILPNLDFDVQSIQKHKVIFLIKGYGMYGLENKDNSIKIQKYTHVSDFPLEIKQVFAIDHTFDSVFSSRKQWFKERNSLFQLK